MCIRDRSVCMCVCLCVCMHVCMCVCVCVCVCVCGGNSHYAISTQILPLHCQVCVFPCFSCSIASFMNTTSFLTNTQVFWQVWLGLPLQNTKYAYMLEASTLKKVVPLLSKLAKTFRTATQLCNKFGGSGRVLSIFKVVSYHVWDFECSFFFSFSVIVVVHLAVGAYI